MLISIIKEKDEIIERLNNNKYNNDNNLLKEYKNLNESIELNDYNNYELSDNKVNESDNKSNNKVILESKSSSNSYNNYKKFNLDYEDNENDDVPQDIRQVLKMSRERKYKNSNSSILNKSNNNIKLEVNDLNSDDKYELNELVNKYIPNSNDRDDELFVSNKLLNISGKHLMNTFNPNNNTSIELIDKDEYDNNEIMYESLDNKHINNKENNDNSNTTKFIFNSSEKKCNNLKDKYNNNENNFSFDSSSNKDIIENNYINNNDNSSSKKYNNKYNNTKLNNSLKMVREEKKKIDNLIGKYMNKTLKLK